MFKALIFDFDGIIMDTESPEVQVWQDILFFNIFRSSTSMINTLYWSVFSWDYFHSALIWSS